MGKAADDLACFNFSGRIAFFCSLYDLGVSLIDPAGFVLPLAFAIILLLVALAVAAGFVRRR